MTTKQTLRKALALLLVCVMGAILAFGALAETTLDLSQYTQKTVGTTTVYVDKDNVQWVLDPTGTTLILYTPPAAPQPAPNGGKKPASNGAGAAEGSSGTGTTGTGTDGTGTTGTGTDGTGTSGTGTGGTGTTGTGTDGTGTTGTGTDGTGTTGTGTDGMGTTGTGTDGTGTAGTGTDGTGTTGTGTDGTGTTGTGTDGTGTTGTGTDSTGTTGTGTDGTGTDNGAGAPTPEEPALTLSVAASPATAKPNEQVTITVTGTVSGGGKAPKGVVEVTSAALPGLAGEAKPLESGADSFSTTFTGFVPAEGITGVQQVSVNYEGGDYTPGVITSSFEVAGVTEATAAKIQEGTVDMAGGAIVMLASYVLPLSISIDPVNFAPGAPVTITVTANPTQGAARGSIGLSSAAFSSITPGLQFNGTTATFNAVINNDPALANGFGITATYAPGTAQWEAYSAQTYPAQTFYATGGNVLTAANTTVVFTPGSPFAWTGSTVAPSVDVYFNGVKLTHITDYNYEFLPTPGLFGPNPGTYYARIHGAGVYGATIPFQVPFVITSNATTSASFEAITNQNGTFTLRLTVPTQPGLPAATGIVSFTLPNGDVRQAVMTNGVAVYTVNDLPPNHNHIFYASYSGDTNYLPSAPLSAQARHHVNPTPHSSVGINLSAKMQSNNRHATLKVSMSSRWWCYGPTGWGWYNNPYNVAPDGSGYGLNWNYNTNWNYNNGWFDQSWNNWNRYPTGWVTFYAGNTMIGTVRLENGEATLTWRNVPTGTHTITAVYTGDHYFAGGRACTTLKRKASSTSTTPKATAAPTTPTSGVKLRDAGGNILETYNTWQMQPVEDVLTLSTARDLNYYSFGFPMSEFSQRATTPGQFTLVSPYFNVIVPYDFVKGIEGYAEYATRNNISTGDVEVRVSVRKLDASALSMATNGMDASSMGDFYRLDVTLHRADGTAYDFNPGEFKTPLQLLIPGMAQATTALFYDETSRSLLPVGIASLDGAAAITVEWNGIYTVSADGGQG